MAIASVQDYFDTIQSRFKAAGAPDQDVKLNWDIAGEKWRAELVNGALVNVGGGEFAEPDLWLIFRSAAEFVQIQNGEISASHAYHHRWIMVGGPPMLQRTMPRWLSPDLPS